MVVADKYIEKFVQIFHKYRNCMFDSDIDTVEKSFKEIQKENSQEKKK